MDTRTKQLRYRRATFSGAAARPRTETLEKSIDEAHNNLKNIVSRRTQTARGMTLECRASRKRKGVGTLLHITAYTAREHASVVPSARGQDEEAPTSTVPPPPHAEYMDGDLFLLICGDNVITCSSGLHEHKFNEYCVDVFHRAGLPPRSSQFHLASVANVDLMDVIAQEGVKQVSLGTSVFAASVDHARRKTLKRTLGAGVFDAFRAIFAEDPTFKDIDQQENLSAELVIKFDGRRKGGEVGRERIERLAERLVTESPEGFSIRTGKNTVLGHEEVALQKPVSIRAQGKTVQVDAVFAELVRYFLELKDAGHLER